MYYKYPPYPYFNRYYNINPYNYYRRYYNPYYNYQQNIIDSQIANVDQSIINYGDMNDVIQDSDIYQSMASDPEFVEIVVVESPTEQPVETPPEPPTSVPTPHVELPPVELPPEIPQEIPLFQPPPLNLP